jgi:hypothetical protein
VIRLATLCGSIGVAVCLLLIAGWKISSIAGFWTISSAIARIAPVLWPASIGLMAIHGGSATSGVILVYAILILINGALYAAIGVIVAALIKLATARGT